MYFKSIDDAMSSADTIDDTYDAKGMMRVHADSSRARRIPTSEESVGVIMRCLS